MSCPYLLEGGDDYGTCEISGRTLKVAKISSYCVTTTYTTCSQYLAEEGEDEDY